jgi:hypothetical protein
MAKYSKKRVAHICSLIKKDSYTISELCSLSGIAESTYYEWIESKPEFSEAIEKAREAYDRLLVKEAKASLMKKIKGYTVQETKTVMIDSGKPGPDGKTTPKIKERTVVDKTFQPDTTAIIFALTNKAPEEYKNRQSAELTGKDGKDLFANLSNEELEARIAELEKKLTK